MKYSQFSKDRLRRRIREYSSTVNIRDALESYLLYGFDPGSCYKAFFAGDSFNCFLHGHPANNFLEFKEIAAFIINQCPKIAFGSYENVDLWIKLSSKDRRQYLELADLVFSEEEELLKELESSDEYTDIPNW